MRNDDVLNQKKMADSSVDEAEGMRGFMRNFASELFGSPLNIALLGICGFLLFKIFKNKREPPPKPPEPEIPPMKKRDFTLEQLSEYDGKGPEGRILMAVNGKVFDVTRGKRFYGPGGPYGVFAGKDGSRGLGTFSLTEEAIRDQYDDLSDLNSMQMDSIREWEMQFMEKYDLIGRYLRPGEEPTDYTDTEDDQSTHESSQNKSKDD